MSIRKHTAYNLLGALLPMAVALLTIPIYIRLVRDARYGVLAVVWSFLEYFGMFDVGLGSATAQRIAALGNSSSEVIARIFWIALAMNSDLGAFGGLLIWPISNYFFGRFISMGRTETRVGPAYETSDTHGGAPTKSDYAALGHPRWLSGPRCTKTRTAPVSGSRSQSSRMRWLVYVIVQRMTRARDQCVEAL